MQLGCDSNSSIPEANAPIKLKSKSTDTTPVGNCGIPLIPHNPATIPATAVINKP